VGEQNADDTGMKNEFGEISIWVAQLFECCGKALIFYWALAPEGNPHFTLRFIVT